MTIKFNDITTAAELRTRIHNGLLSLGNRTAIIQRFLLRPEAYEAKLRAAGLAEAEIAARMDADALAVRYTPNYGAITRIFYLAA